MVYANHRNRFGLDQSTIRHMRASVVHVTLKRLLTQRLVYANLLVLVYTNPWTSHPGLPAVASAHIRGQQHRR